MPIEMLNATMMTRSILTTISELITEVYTTIIANPCEYFVSKIMTRISREIIDFLL